MEWLTTKWDLFQLYIIEKQIYALETISVFLEIGNIYDSFNRLKTHAPSSRLPRVGVISMGLFLSSKFMDDLSWEAWSSTGREKQNKTTRLYH